MEAALKYEEAVLCHRDAIGTNRKGRSGRGWKYNTIYIYI